MRSPRFCFMRTMTLRNRDGTPYLKRWRIFQCPWFALWLHRIDGPDEDRALHDHPRAFISFVLRGGYVEEIPCGDGNMLRMVRRINVKGARDLHRIVYLEGHAVGDQPARPRPTWTLVLCGPVRREWGFQTEDGWVPHDEYFGSAVASWD